MSDKKTIKRQVTRAYRSPLNEKRWACVLECGHETWVTSVSRPKRADCYQCEKAQP